MKRRYWLSAALLFVLGAGIWALVYGFQFTGILLCLSALVVLAFGVVDALRRKWPRGMRLLHRLMVAGLCLLLVAMIVTACFIGSAADREADCAADYVIVLGAGVNGTAPSQSLYERLLAAEAYLDAHPQAIAVLSGGCGDYEHISEAECMYRWLTARGVPEDRLRKEEQSTSTKENLRNSLELIEAQSGSHPAQVAVVSSEYHLYRAAFLAQQQDLHILGVPAQTQGRLFLCNMFVREIVAVWAAWLGL